MTDQFVNPYTFVPLPGEKPQRSAPHGHLGNRELLSGKLSVRFTALTPLLIRGFGERDEAGRPANTLPRRPDGTAFIPGSSYKGATRSVHETLTGSCLRVFDADFLPSYRDPVASRPERVLAVVTKPPDADQPPTVVLCQKGDMRKHRLHQDVLRKFGGELRSGQRLNVRSWDGDRGKPEIELAGSGQWVLFLSDAGARDKSKPYQAHIRQITEHEVDVAPEAWKTFLRVVEGTGDRRTRQRSRNGDNSTAPVVYEYEPQKGRIEKIPVGHRHLAGPNLERGQPVWVDIDVSRNVTWLGLAMNWRHEGGTAAGERVGAFKPCDNPDELCPSCRLLGAIDPNERDKLEAADQLAYRGHVRFGDALADGNVGGVGVTLPPMGAPRPGAGQAYLDNSKISEGAKEAHPLREWGAPGADGKNPRRIRGRKHYWQAAPNGREQVRQHQLDDHAELTTEAEIFPEGTEFRATVTFTDVDKVQLGSLLAALQPSLLLEDRAVRTHIGGGKPLGYGQCRTEIDLGASVLHRNGTRYGLDQEKCDLSEDTPALIEAFRASVGAAVRETWPLMNRVLRPDAVPDEIVWYPPGAPWKKRETGEKEHVEKFDTGFEFWKQSAGFASSQEKDGGYPLKSLPKLRSKRDLDEGYDQAMDIVEKDP